MQIIEEDGVNRMEEGNSSLQHRTPEKKASFLLGNLQDCNDLLHFPFHAPRQALLYATGKQKLPECREKREGEVSMKCVF
jgi:hypothetical protein